MTIIYGVSAPGTAEMAPEIIRCFSAAQRDAAPANMPQILSYKPSTADRTNLRAATSSSAAICQTLINYFSAIPDIAVCWACWYHEPDNDNVTGYPADYKTEWQQLLTYVKPSVNSGRTHPIQFVPIFCSFNGTGIVFGNNYSRATADQWIASGVDAFGVDTYASYVNTANNASDYAGYSGKPWMVPELGYNVGPSVADSTMLTRAQAQIAAFTGAAHPPTHVLWYDNNYNVVVAQLTSATGVNATSIPVSDMTVDGMAAGSTIVVDATGPNPETVSLSVAAAGGANSVTIAAPGLQHTHAKNAIVYLKPALVEYWLTLNGTPPPPYQPFGADSGTSGASSPVSFTLPGGIADGSVAVAAIQLSGQPTVTPPGLWAEASGSPFNSNNTDIVHVYTSPIGSSDSNTVVQFGLSAGARWNVKGFIVPDATTSGLDAIASNIVASTTSRTSLTGPAITPVAADCVKGVFIAPRVGSNITSAVNQDSGDGYTDLAQSQTASAGNTNLLLDVQALALSGQAGVPQAANTFTTTNNVTNYSVIAVTVAPFSSGHSSSSVDTTDDLTVSDAITGRSQSTEHSATTDVWPLTDAVSRSGHTGHRSVSDTFSFSTNPEASSFLSLATHTFTPPTIPYPLDEQDPIHLGRFMRPKGVSVLRIGGQYFTVEYPSDIQIAQATEVYYGGHSYLVDGVTAAALVAAGYEIDTPDSLGATASGTLPPSFQEGGDPGQWGYVPRSYNPTFPLIGTPDSPLPSYNDV